MSNVELWNKELDFRSKYDAVETEINQVVKVTEGDPKIEENVVTALDGEFGKILNDDGHINEKKKLKNAVDQIENNPDFKKNAGNALTLLKQRLNDFESTKTKKDFDEFLKRINNPKSLSGMNEDQIRRVNLFLQGDEDAALGVYGIMKGKFDGKGNLKGQDKEFFESVWNTLKGKYENSDKFLEKDYGKIESTAGSLRYFIKNFGGGFNWNGENLITIPAKEGIISSREKAVNKFNEMNIKRIEGNKAAIKLINIGNEAFDNFTFKNGSITLNNFGPVSQENIVNALNVVNVLNASNTIVGTDFVGPDERNKTIQECAGDLYNNLRTKLEQKNRNDSLVMDNNLWTKMNDIQDLKGEKAFITLDSNNNVTYYPEKAAAYLSFLNANGQDWSFYRKLDINDGRRQAWISAVQILLNNDKRLLSDGKEPLKVTGELNLSDKNDSTRQRITDFQKLYPKTFNGKNRGFFVDGLPGKNTIEVLIDNQNMIESNDKINTVISKLGLTKSEDSAVLSGYGLDQNVSHYNKEGEISLYYLKGSDIYKVVPGETYQESKAILLDDGNIKWENPKFRVCGFGAGNLTDAFKGVGENLSKFIKDINGQLIINNSEDNSKYMLKCGDGVNIGINPNDSVLFGEKPFCGVTNNLQKIKLVGLAGVVKAKFGGADVSKSPVGIRNTNDGYGDNSDNQIGDNDLLKYGLKRDENFDTFVDYCNKLKKGNDGAYFYEKDKN